MANRPLSLLGKVLTSTILLAVFGGAAFGLWRIKRSQQAAAAAAAAAMPEPAEMVVAATVRQRSHARTTTSIGTVRALQSIMLRNELPGTVRKVAMQAGQVVEPGAVLVELDVTVETAELQALEAEARLAGSMAARMEQAMQSQGASAADVDRARAEHDKALANVARIQALIERKRVRAPFKARVGMVDLHPGQYLEPGTTITSLQGVDDAVHVDFAIPQDAAAALRPGHEVEVTVGESAPARAQIVAIDARVEAATRNTWIRALLPAAGIAPAPGAAVRVRVPVEAVRTVLVVPVSALRRGPAGDHVFALVDAPDGKIRAATRTVRSGAVLGDEVIVESGLSDGDRIAADGSFKLREGALVQLAPAPGTEPQQAK